MTSTLSYRATHEANVAGLRQRLRKVAEGGGGRQGAAPVRGKLLPRDRVDGVPDVGSPFLEVASLAAGGMYDDKAPAAGVIAGVGRIHGRECMIVANDATVSGGTYYPITVKKHLRAQEIAAANRLPCIYLVDSGGAMLLQQDEVFSRPGPRRPHLLQPGHHERRRHPADLGRTRIIDRGWCLRPGDERRDRDRARSGAPSSWRAHRW